MSYELDHNARSIPIAEVPRSFVPPEPHFARLLSRDHMLVVGPRGSGKTTLLKMLTVRALSNWVHPSAETLCRKIAFNAAFVPADKAWGKQVEALESLSLHPRRREAAFVIHTLRALVYAMREAVDLARGTGPSPHLAHLAVKLTHAQEEQVVTLVSASFGIVPPINSLLGLELALEERLDKINVGASDDSFGVESFPSKLRLLISTFNGTARDDERRWALLFDELEIAPTSIQSFLLAGIRSIDSRVVIKLAIAPYMGDVGFDSGPTSPQISHDYHTVQLTYPNKEDARSFSEQLFLSTFGRLGLNFGSLADAFVDPPDVTGFGRRQGAMGKRIEIPSEFRSLARKDSSFRSYVLERGLLDAGYKFTEDNIARDVRKVLPIVIARDYYLRRFEESRAVRARSRKSHVLYSGYPSIVEITEGNPRAILTLIGAMAQANSVFPISVSAQSQALRRVEFLLTSLLQVIPLDLGGFKPGKGLLDFVDQIGRAFEARLLWLPFSTDYVGTFNLDDNVTTAVVAAVGKALNAGAFVHVPHPDSSGTDSLLRGLRGQRFRISYALAARFRLLLTLGDRVNLSNLLRERQLRIPLEQPSLFGGDQPDDHS